VTKIFKVILFIAIFSITGKLYAQENDAALWLNFSLQKNLTQSLSISCNEELRLNENFSELGTLLTDFSFNYRISEHFDISANYRFSNKRRLDDSYSKRHRYYFDFSYKYKVNQVQVSFRSRFQSQYNDYNSSAEGHIPKNHFREKISLQYDASDKITPYFFLEPYLLLNSSQSILFDNIRFSLGIEYKFNRIHKLNLYYMIQKEMNVKNPLTEFITGIGYSVTL